MNNTFEIGKPTILLVDDSPSSIGPIFQSLEDAGFNVLVATDGLSALERLELVSVDAILLDAVMPGLSGFETCFKIKENPAHAHLPIIFMTGLADTEHIVNAFQSGSVDYVVKPVNVDEVLVRLQTHIRNARLAKLASDSMDTSRIEQAALTTRETEVLSWLAKGKTNRDIAEILEMSPRTVSKHLEHIFEKLGVETRSAAAAIGVRLGTS